MPTTVDLLESNKFQVHCPVFFLLNPQNFEPAGATSNVCVQGSQRSKLVHYTSSTTER